MKNTQQTFHDAILRTDFDLFLRRCLMTLNPGARILPNWHLDAIAHQLDRVRRGETTRIIFNMPPRHLKSMTVSVAFPAYLLGLDPRRRIFAISYSSELSSKHASDFRSIVESPWYRRAFPDMRIARSLEDEVVTTARGFRKATSVHGTLTGLGGDIFIIDDPQKPADAQSDTQRNGLNQWVSNTLMSRLDNKQTGIIIVVMQRVHLNDLSGYLIEIGGVGRPEPPRHRGDKTKLSPSERTNFTSVAQARPCIRNSNRLGASRSCNARSVPTCFPRNTSSRRSRRAAP